MSNTSSFVDLNYLFEKKGYFGEHYKWNRCQDNKLDTKHHLVLTSLRATWYINVLDVDLALSSSGCCEFKI